MLQYIFIKKHSILINLACLVIAIFSSPALAANHNTQNNNTEVRFDFYPSVFTSNLDVSTEPMFLYVRGDGRASVVNYGVNFWSDNIVVHQGILPKKYVAELISKVRRAITEASRSRRYEGGPQDEPVFNLSVTVNEEQAGEQRALEYLGLLGQPRAVISLVSELRMLWKRLKKAQPAYAYVRRESIGIVSREDVKRDSRFISFQSFPRKLRPILINAVRNPLSFYALSRSQISQLSKFMSSHNSLSLIYKEHGYGLALYLPRADVSKPQKKASSNEDEG